MVVSLVFFDIITVLLGFGISYHIRTLINSPIQTAGFYLPYIILSAFSLAILFSYFRLYRPSIHSVAYYADFLKASTGWGLSLILFSYFTKTDYARSVLTLHFVITFFFLYLLRIFYSKRASTDGEDDEIELIAKDLTELIKTNKVHSIGLDSRPLYLFTKRCYDILIGLCLLPVYILFFPFIAILIKRDSAGPVLIKQLRIKKNVESFVMYKFRTMKMDTNLYEIAPTGDDDPRISRVGKLLRRYSLDELPQILNVLKGDMSIVGPRPEMEFIVRSYEPWQRIRMHVKPGITGLWQILGRKDKPLHLNSEYDVYYVFHQSLFLDFAIMLRTIPHLLFPKGAY